MILTFGNLLPALCTGAASFLGAYFLARKKNAQDVRNASDTRVREMERQIAVLGQQVLPIATAFQALLIKQLTHYHTEELDGLMVKMGPPFALTATEEHRLIVLLEERTRDVGGLIDASERDAATMLPLIMTRVRSEALLRAQDVEIMLVAVERTEAK